MLAPKFFIIFFLTWIGCFCFIGFADQKNKNDTGLFLMDSNPHAAQWIYKNPLAATLPC